MTNQTIKIESEDFTIKCDYSTAKIFQQVIEGIKKSNGQSIETKFIKIKSDVFRIESKNFAGNLYTFEQLSFEQLTTLKKFADTVANCLKASNRKVKIVNVEFGINANLKDLTF